MIFGDGLIALLILGFWIFCIVDVITTDEGSVRNLPKLVWLLIVIFLAEIGSIAWLIAGRPRGAAANTPYKGNAGRAYRRGPNIVGPPTATNPDDDEEFLRLVRQRAEDQRRRAREQQPPEPPVE